jgi:hypothetical protein
MQSGVETGFFIRFRHAQARGELTDDEDDKEDKNKYVIARKKKKKPKSAMVVKAKTSEKFDFEFDDLFKLGELGAELDLFDFLELSILLLIIINYYKVATCITRR